MNLTEVLKQLCEAEGVSGAEQSAAAVARELLKPYCDEVHEDHNGNVIGTLGSNEPDAVHILLDAHLDQVGMIVTDITDEGFVRVGNVGGLDMRLMPAQNVLLHGQHQTIPGTVASVPPHLSGGEEKVLNVSELLIDTGYDAASLKEMIALGDRVSYDTPFMTMLGSCVTGRALDDRCGMAAILYALELLKEEKLSCRLSVLFSAQEEVGEYGAKTAAFTLNPDIAIAVDVTFAMAHGDDPVKCGKLEGGPMIGISPTLSRQVSNDLIAAAERENIPWKAEVMAGTTGTNADRFSVTRGGVRACTLSIPLRYMHTPAEVISMQDVEAVGKVLAAYVKEAPSC